MPLITPIFQKTKESNTLSNIDDYMLSQAKKLMDNMKYGLSCKVSLRDYEYLCLLRDVYMEKVNGNPCTCHIVMGDIKNEINKITENFL